MNVKSLNTYYAKLIRHGGSVRVSIHPVLRRALNLKVGDTMEIAAKADVIMMKKLNTTFDERRVK